MKKAVNAKAIVVELRLCGNSTQYILQTIKNQKTVCSIFRKGA